MNKKKVEKLLIIFTIIIAIIIASIVYLIKNGAQMPNLEIIKDNNIVDNTASTNNTKETENIISEENVDHSIETSVDEWKESGKIAQEDIKIERVDDLYTYFLLKQCLANYYNPENTRKGLDILDDEAKSDLGITLDNVANFYSNKAGAGFCIDKIFKQRTNIEDSSQNLYIVYHRVGINSSKKDQVVFVKIEERNICFSIYPQEYLEKNNYLNLTQNDVVKINNIQELAQNDNNVYKVSLISKSDWSCTKELYDRYKFDVQYDLEGLYNKLNEEYKNIKFQSYDSFVQYINDTKERILNQEVSKYGVNTNGEYKEYIALCGENDHLVFYTRNLMEYVVSLDNYTATSLQYLSAYNETLPSNQAIYCIDRVIKAINDKNYEFIYNKLNSVQKYNYYSNFEDFKTFIINGFYNKNDYEIEDNKVMVTQNIYQYSIKVTDAEMPDSKNYKKFVMAVTLKGDMDFSISITK